jgi:hypothetical protein
MLQKWSGRIAGLVLAASMLSGCLMAVGAMVGVGAYQWMEGTMAKDYPRTMEPTYRACVQACKTMKLAINKEKYGPMNSSITATAPDATNVYIDLIARPNDITTVKVRFGLMGDKDQSAYFHRNVMRNLGIQ